VRADTASSPRYAIDTNPGDTINLLEFARRTMQRENVDCVFGTRFSHGGRVIDYLDPKLMINRFANFDIRLMFEMRYDDVSNTFKSYRREVVEGVQPLMNHYFNLTVEIPLTAIVRGYTSVVVPNPWTNRSHGTSKFEVEEMGSRYAFNVPYCLLERLLSRGDDRRTTKDGTSRPHDRVEP